MKSAKNRPIGIFDSGVGGLTVAKSVRKKLPNEDIIYFGDTARVPYGNKGKDTIIRFSREIMDFLVKKKVKLVVVACNTASSFSLKELKKSYKVPVVGVISPGMREAVKRTKTGRIGVIGTTSTISSGAYNKELKRIAKKPYKIYSKDCPLFVPLVENKFSNDRIAYEVAEKYLGELKKRKIDSLILGCTHYPILKKVIQKVMKHTNLIDSSVAVAEEVKKVLKKEKIESPKRKGKLSCFVSDDVDNFRSISGIFLKERTSVKKVVL